MKPANSDNGGDAVPVGDLSSRLNARLCAWLGDEENIGRLARPQQFVRQMRDAITAGKILLRFIPIDPEGASESRSSFYVEGGHAVIELFVDKAVLDEARDGRLAEMAVEMLDLYARNAAVANIAQKPSSSPALAFGARKG